MAAITSRKVNGTWLRSDAQFDVTDATSTFAQAIATYPVGQERFLNGGDNVNGNGNTGDSGNQGGNSGNSGDSGNTGGNGGDNGGGDDADE